MAMLKQCYILIRPTLLACWGYRNKMPQAACLKQQKFNFLPFCNLEVQDQSVSSFDFFFFLRSLSLACRQPSSCCVLAWPLLCVSLVSLPLFMKTTVLLE